MTQEAGETTQTPDSLATFNTIKSVLGDQEKRELVKGAEKLTIGKSRHFPTGYDGEVIYVDHTLETLVEGYSLHLDESFHVGEVGLITYSSGARSDFFNHPYNFNSHSFLHMDETDPSFARKQSSKIFLERKAAMLVAKFTREDPDGEL